MIDKKIELPLLTIGKHQPKYPIIQGGMGIMVSGPRLAGAVAAAGGIGTIASVGLAASSPDFDMGSGSKNIDNQNHKILSQYIKEAKETSNGGVIAVNCMCALSDYDQLVRTSCEAGADIVTVHVEADTPENTLEAIRRIRACGKKPAVCGKPKTPAEAVLPYLELVDLILVMTVEPGFGGQSFMADMMPKVSEIRRYIDARNPACELEVDGGVDAVTCKTCIEAGANVLVAGSAVYKAADIPAKIKELRG